LVILQQQRRRSRLIFGSRFNSENSAHSNNQPGRPVDLTDSWEDNDGQRIDGGRSVGQTDAF
jgi:hypothetical protein